MVPAVVVAATLVCGATPGPAATADGSTPAARCAVSRELVPSCGVLLGAATHKVGTQTWDQSVATHEKLIGRKVDVQHNYHQWDTRQRGGLTDPDHPRRRCRQAVRAGFDRRWFGLAGYPRIRRRLRHLPGSGRSVVQLPRAGDGLEPGQGGSPGLFECCHSGSVATRQSPSHRRARRPGRAHRDGRRVSTLNTPIILPKR